jgi:hypothetical protein
MFIRGWFVFLLATGGCAAVREDLRRAEVAFDEARYENAEVWLESLEGDVPSMEREMRSRYYYLRGVSAYRLGDKSAARHFLALCREEAMHGEASGLGLRTEWRSSLEKLLAELDPNSRRANAAGDEAPPPVQL